jgi:acyl carrier protein
MSVRSAILSEFAKVAAEQNKPLPNLTDDMPLLDTGLDSLCFAIIVVRLEEELGFDPFGTMEGEAFPVTLGDFVKLYEDAEN